MKRFSHPLRKIQIASPCSANWDSMIGNNRRRYCGDCKLNVFNLSEMSQRESEDLIAGSEGSICVRFYQRADGSVITKDCPVGLALLKKKISRFWTATASLLLTLVSGAAAVSYIGGHDELHSPQEDRRAANVEVMGAMPIESFKNSGDPEPLMGNVTVLR